MSAPAKQHTIGSPAQHQARERLLKLFAERPFDDGLTLSNLPLFMRSSGLAKLLFLDELYRQITHVPGIIVEFGVWLGHDLAMFESLRGVYEPYNYTRRIVGFDTFMGYQSFSDEDERCKFLAEGWHLVPEGYPDYLRALLDYHEAENTMSHIKKYDLVIGDVVETAGAYFRDHAEAVVALAYFDLALYKPTKACLEAIRPHLARGSILAFDELNNPQYPGETVAVRETLGLDRYRLLTSRYVPDRSYIIIE